MAHVTWKKKMGKKQFVSVMKPCNTHQTQTKKT